MKQEEFLSLSPDELFEEISNGGRFVIYRYVYSYIAMSERRPSKVFFLKSGEPAIKHGWPYLLISLFFGWWGIPWGPIWTIQAIVQSFMGVDVTALVENILRESIENHTTPQFNFDDM